MGKCFAQFFASGKKLRVFAAQKPAGDEAEPPSIIGGLRVKSGFSQASAGRLGKPRSGFPAVFLDRDGTLNRQLIRDGRPYPPQTLAQFELFPDVPAACAKLADAGFVLVVVTNQPDVGRGTQSQAEVESMHEKLRSLLPQIARVEVCYAPGRAGEPPDRRRKPEPGMVLDAALELNLDLSRSWMVGDRWRDVDCGKRAGLRTVFIDYGYAEELRAAPDFTVKSFAQAAAVILADAAAPDAP